LEYFFDGVIAINLLSNPKYCWDQS